MALSLQLRTNVAVTYVIVAAMNLCCYYLWRCSYSYELMLLLLLVLSLQLRTNVTATNVIVAAMN